MTEEESFSRTSICIFPPSPSILHQNITELPFLGLGKRQLLCHVSSTACVMYDFLRDTPILI